MRLLDGADLGKEESDVVEALFLRLLGELGVHVGPLEVLAVGGVREVHFRRGHFAAMQVLEPDLGMFFLVLGGFLEEVRNLDIAVLAGLSGIIEILGVGLGLTGEGGLEIGLGLCSFQFHNSVYCLYICV